MNRYSLKKSWWPEADRAMWERLITRAGLLEEGGAGAHWADETKRVAERDYGYWLQYLLATVPQALAEHPASRVTRDRVRSYCGSMQDVSAGTRASRIARLYAIVTGAHPTTDWRWLAKLRRGLERTARREGPAHTKQGRLRSSAELFDAGLAMLTCADAAGHLRPREQAEQFRDGLMIAVLAARPLRIRNFADLRLGRHIHGSSGTFWLDVPGQETKTGRPIETFIPDELYLWMKRYLEYYRPVLLAGRQSGHVWVHRNGSGYTAGSLGMRISVLTKKLIGVRINPHLFRDCAATTIATDDPKHVMTIASILGHSTLKTAEKHYNQVRSLEAGRRYQESIRELRDHGRSIKRRLPR